MSPSPRVRREPPARRRCAECLTTRSSPTSARLLDAGYKVAVCDQVEDPAQARGLVRREVTRVVTPGTISDLEMLDQNRPNYLAGIRFNGGAGAGAFLDVSTGEFFVRRWPDAALRGGRPRAARAPRGSHVRQPTSRRGANEARDASAPGLDRARRTCRTRRSTARRRRVPPPRSAILRRQFQVENLRGFGLVEGEAAVAAAALVLEYARQRLQVGDRSRNRAWKFSTTTGAWWWTTRRSATWRSFVTSSTRRGRTLVDVLDLTLHRARRPRAAAVAEPAAARRRRPPGAPRRGRRAAPEHLRCGSRCAREVQEAWPTSSV